jgi:hypothetical protein
MSWKHERFEVTVKVDTEIKPKSASIISFNAKAVEKPEEEE